MVLEFLPFHRFLRKVKLLFMGKTVPKEEYDDLLLDILSKLEEISKKLEECETLIKYAENRIKKKKPEGSKRVQTLGEKIKLLHSIYKRFYESILRKETRWEFRKGYVSRETIWEIKNFLGALENLLKSLNNLNKELGKKNLRWDNINVIMQDIVKEDTIIKQIESDDVRKVSDIIKEVVKEADDNKRKRIFLRSNQGNKLEFSAKQPLIKLRRLELIPFLHMLRDIKNIFGEIERGSFLEFVLHEDNSLPVKHYNLIINGRNIHVIPKEFANGLENYIYR